MISPQTLPQIVSLTQLWVCRAHDSAKSQVHLSGYRNFDRGSGPSSVADPSHSPIERGQQHGTLSGGMGDGGVRSVSDLVMGIRDIKLERTINKRKGIKICLQDLRIKLTRSLKFLAGVYHVKRRSLDG